MNPILAIVTADDSDVKESDAGNAKKKKAAAEDLIKAVGSKDSDGVVEAVTALYRLCALDEE